MGEAIGQRGHASQVTRSPLGTSRNSWTLQTSCGGAGGRVGHGRVALVGRGCRGQHAAHAHTPRTGAEGTAIVPHHLLLLEKRGLTCSTHNTRGETHTHTHVQEVWVGQGERNAKSQQFNCLFNVSLSDTLHSAMHPHRSGLQAGYTHIPGKGDKEKEGMAAGSG